MLVIEMLKDPNGLLVTLGCILLGASAAIVGCFTFLRKRTLVGDAVAHAVLPGVALAFIIFRIKNPFLLLGGAALSGWLSLLTIDFITNRSRIKPDAAIGLVLSVFFGIGILLLTSIQNSGDAAQSGLDSFLFGKAASLLGADLWTFSAVAVVLVAVVLLFYKEFALLSFDKEFAVVNGLPVRWLEFILSTITVLAIAIGIQAVGVVLMAALLITPAAAARFWTDRLDRMVIFAAALGAFSGFAGAYVSFTAPAMPTGPWIVMVLSLIAIGSFFLSPKKGILARHLAHRRNRRKMLHENILKTLYMLGEAKENWKTGFSPDEVNNRRQFPQRSLNKALQKLKQKQFLQTRDSRWAFTEKGLEEGARVTRLHRLWELYLTEYLRIAPDHVHEDAEAIEHVITPEIEDRLQEILGFPELDPHQSKIPYKKPNTNG